MVEMAVKQTKKCRHCKGNGECSCEMCAISPDAEGLPIDDFDTGRQEECTCKICNGLGQTNLNGTAIEL